MTDRPSRHGLPLAEKLPNAKQEQREKATAEQLARDNVCAALKYLNRALTDADRPAADACYKALVIQYAAWQAKDSALVQITMLVRVYEKRLTEEADATVFYEPKESP
jgi:hypothetical protein